MKVFSSTYAHGLRLLERDAAYFRLALLSTGKEIGIKRFYYVLLGRNFKTQPRYLASLTRALSLPLPLSVIKVPITTKRTQLQLLFPTFFRYYAVVHFMNGNSLVLHCTSLTAHDKVAAVKSSSYS